jgi:hypothetical protein
MTNAAGNLGQGLAGSELAAGQARASGYVGQANALAGALQGIGQSAASFPLYQAQINYLNKMPSSGGGGIGGGTPAIPGTKGPAY